LTLALHDVLCSASEPSPIDWGKGPEKMNNNLRITRGISREEPFYIQVNGKPVIAYPSETIATVLLASGRHVFRHTALSGEPRGLFCGMGVCFDCLVIINGHKNVRSCVTFAHPGDEIQGQIE
jgi:hypothetical protein